MGLYILITLSLIFGALVAEAAMLYLEFREPIFLGTLIFTIALTIVTVYVLAPYALL